MIRITAYNGTTLDIQETDIFVAITVFLNFADLHSQDIKKIERIEDGVSFRIRSKYYSWEEE